MTTTEANLKSEENLETKEETSTCKKLLQPKFLIPIIAGAVVIIVVVVVLVVVLTKDDDSSSLEDDGSDSWSIAYKKAKEFLKPFTNEEKFYLLYGFENCMGECVGSIEGNANRKFPGICLHDGPAGVRTSNAATSWQASINSASTFNRELVYKVGQAQGKEFKDKGVNIMLTPCINILKHPKGGRIWEAYGEDPFLTGELGAEVIKGMQSNGILASAKHYVGNEHETYRMNSSSNIPDEALFEVYIEPFYKAVKKGDVATIMESYNAVNFTFMTRHKRLLQDVLKDKIGFKGFIMSDWYAINTEDPSNFNNGLDMNMPGGSHIDFNNLRRYYGREKSFWYDLPNWLADGKTTQERIDDATIRIIASLYKFNQLSDTFDESKIYPDGTDLNINTISATNNDLNRQVARESIILLKNNENVLPLANNKHNSVEYKKFAVIGNDAIKTSCTNISNNVCINSTTGAKYIEGHLFIGWGSGATDINFTNAIDPITAITERVNKISGSSLTSSTNLLHSGENTHTEDIASVATAITDAEVIIVFIMADSGENLGEDQGKVENILGDREDFEPWHDGTGLVNEVLDKKTSTQKVIVVINAPSVVNMPWFENVDAVLFAGMAGSQSGNGLVDILFGDYSASGHLTYVWSNQSNYADDQPGSFVNFTDNSVDYIQANYTYHENLFIGQRWFEKNNLDYMFPFGYGLSYSEFTYSDLSLSMAESGLTVTFKVKNTGLYKAKVVPMVFLGFPSSVPNYPAKVFKGFDKKELDVNEEVTFSILVEPHDLSYYSVSEGDFVRPTSGEYTVYVNENARDNKLTKTISASY